MVGGGGGAAIRSWVGGGGGGALWKRPLTLKHFQMGMIHTGGDSE